MSEKEHVIIYFFKTKKHVKKHFLSEMALDTKKTLHSNNSQ